MNDDSINEQFANIAMNDFADRVEELVEKIRFCHENTIDALVEDDREKFERYSTEATRLFSQVSWAVMPTVYMATVSAWNKERELSHSTFACLVDVVEHVKDWVQENAAAYPDAADLVQLLDVLAHAQAWIDQAPFEVEVEKD